MQRKGLPCLCRNKKQFSKREVLKDFKRQTTGCWLLSKNKHPLINMYWTTKFVSENYQSWLFNKPKLFHQSHSLLLQLVFGQSLCQLLSLLLHRLLRCHLLGRTAILPPFLLGMLVRLPLVLPLGRFDGSIGRSVMPFLFLWRFLRRIRLLLWYWRTGRNRPLLWGRLCVWLGLCRRLWWWFILRRAWLGLSWVIIFSLLNFFLFIVALRIFFLQFCLGILFALFFWRSRSVFVFSV